MKTKTWFVRFVKFLLNFRAHALQSELSKVSITNFVKFELQSKSSKIERAFEKTNKIYHQNRAKRDIYAATVRTINQCQSLHHIYCKNALLCIVNNLSVVLEIIIRKFSYCLKMMFRNTFPEHQPHSASYHHF